MRVGGLGGLEDLLIGGRGSAVANVLQDGGREENRLLEVKDFFYKIDHQTEPFEGHMLKPKSPALEYGLTEKGLTKKA